MRGKRQDKAGAMAAIVDCSNKHLSPMYDQCTKMILNSDKKETFQCYQRILLSSLVSGCSEDISEATSESLNKVMDCGKDQIMEFLQENAG